MGKSPRDDINAAALHDLMGISFVSEAEKEAVKNWWVEPVEIIKAEYLQVFLRAMLHKHVSNVTADSMNIIAFYPSDSPLSALVVSIQLWNDILFKHRRKKRRQCIEEWSTNWVDFFVAVCRSPEILERWSDSISSEHLIIRHVRGDAAMLKTIAVTENGLTYFDTEGFKRARMRVEAAGGLWPGDMD